MTRDEAINEAGRIHAYFPFRLIAIARGPGSDNWEVIAGRTMARFNNLARKGYTVNMCKWG